MPMSGAHSRQVTGARSANTTRTTSVAPAAVGAAAGDVPSGTSASKPKTIGMTVTAISMITVPETTGVIIRRSSESRAAKAN